MPITRSAFTALGAAALAAAPSLARAQAAKAQTLRVEIFPGAFNWPLFAARDQGIFAQLGLDVIMIPTTGSVKQMSDLLHGDVDLVHTAFDNVVAYSEGQNAAHLSGDVVAFMGGDTGILRLVARPGILAVADLRGKKLGVDAPDTGYAFALRETLARSGLGPGTYELVNAGGTAARMEALYGGAFDATIATVPFDLVAQSRGMTVLADPVAVLGHYQGYVGAALRPYAASHQAVLARYTLAALLGLHWIYDPANRERAAGLLVANGIVPAPLAIRGADALLSTNGRGITRDGALDLDGCGEVVHLRETYGTPRRRLRSAAEYIDPLPYRRARNADDDTVPQREGPSTNIIFGGEEPPANPGIPR